VSQVHGFRSADKHLWKFSIFADTDGLQVPFCDDLMDTGNVPQTVKTTQQINAAIDSEATDYRPFKTSPGSVLRFV